MFEVFCISFAFFLGLAVKQIGLPPLVGFLAAGFGLNWFGQRFGMLPEFTGDALHYLAHLGVLLLLFTVGLKLKLRQIVQPHVIGGSLLHLVITVAIFTPGVHFLLGLEWNIALLLGIALAFSSTVLAAKILETKRELTAFHGRAAIGMSGLPGPGDWLFALGRTLILPLKGLLFFIVLALFRLRARNAFLGALSLTAYSEFGLIVAAGLPVMNEWLVPLALTVALSFTVAAPLNRLAHPLFERIEGFLVRFQTRTAHPDEVPPDLGHVRGLVFGMGRTGSAAYDALQTEISDLVGHDSDPFRVAEHNLAGRQVVLADGEDADFWRSVDLGRLEVAVLAMDDLEAKLIAARKLRRRGFAGPIVSHAMYPDEAERIRDAGADETHLTLQEAGKSLAGHALRCLS